MPLFSKVSFNVNAVASWLILMFSFHSSTFYYNFIATRNDSAFSSLSVTRMTSVCRVTELLGEETAGGIIKSLLLSSVITPLLENSAPDSWRTSRPRAVQGEKIHPHCLCLYCPSYVLETNIDEWRIIPSDRFCFVSHLLSVFFADNKGINSFLHSWHAKKKNCVQTKLAFDTTSLFIRLNTWFCNSSLLVSKVLPGSSSTPGTYVSPAHVNILC